MRWGPGATPVAHAAARSLGRLRERGSPGPSEHFAEDPPHPRADGDLNERAPPEAAPSPTSRRLRSDRGDRRLPDLLRREDEPEADRDPPEDQQPRWEECDAGDATDAGDRRR